MSSKHENRRNILFRYALIIAAILMLSLRIVYKLVDNTVLSAAEWNERAREALSAVDTIAPIRGDILAADGSVLATNMRVYTPCIDFRVPRFDEKAYTDTVPFLADSLAKYFPVRDADEWKAHLLKPLKQKEKSKRPRSFVILADLSLDDAQRIAKFPYLRLRKNKSGLHIDDRLIRVRPYGDMARRSIGAVGRCDTINLPYGKYGLERSLDSLLRGHEGYSKKVPLTSAIVDWTDVAPQNGYNVLTTIDIKMQDIVENELNKVLDVCKAEWGTAILMEVGTGDIKAIANLELSAWTPGAYGESLNYAVQRIEPGSVVKLLSMLVALEDGRIPNLNRVYTTGSYFQCGNKKIKDCVKTDTLTLNRALEISSNIVVSKMILEAYGNDRGRFYTRIKESGFLDPFNTGIAEEVRPRIDSLTMEKPWTRISLANQSYGYSTEISPLYTCALYNAVAGGGRFVRPRLVRGLQGNGVDTIFPVSYVRPRICSEQNAATLRAMLRKVVWGPRGTARRGVRSDKVEIAGKTGTANRILNNAYTQGATNSRLAFCGFFPYDKPRYTCMVVIAYPRETWFSPEFTSGQVVKNIAEAMFARGMLGNTSDFRENAVRKGEYPTYYVANPRTTKRLHAFMGGGASSMLTPPQTSAGKGVPSVLGMGLRDALAKLEGAGYNVTFAGSGYVAGQRPAPGASIPAGTKIALTLRE